MSYLEFENLAQGVFDAEIMRTKGLELQEQYLSADPFPHIAIDDFLSSSALEGCLSKFPTTADPDSESYDRSQERFKTSYNPDYLDVGVRNFFYALNSRPFIQFLENLTGIKGLIPDPYFLGGGFHETKNGGHLDVHADFNLHKPMNLERRLNILIYLNRNWEAEFGGALELWDTDMATCKVKILPEFGRCVVFSTTGNSYHGHPIPVAHPAQQPRRSIALYYYTATWSPEKAAKTTQFRARPGSQDVKDWAVKRDEMITEFLPPVLSRPVLRTIKKMAKR